MSLLNPNPAYSLSELNAAVREVLELSFPAAVWVVAEIAEVRSQANGHCYLGLVEKRNNTVVAQMKATIWSTVYRSLAPRFEKATGERLKAGMQILLSVIVSFHEVYGLSLNIRDIDPSYSLGEMARRRRETLERLQKEGLTERNKTLPLPLVPQRIAVISSATAAGYGDFINHLEQNPEGYAIDAELFQAILQGEAAEASLLSALAGIASQADRFDAVVIIRGGGAQLDLNCFDSYRLAAAIARCPLPVFTGIGHERDDTVADIVAHTKLKTPTAVAEFLLSRLRDFGARVLQARQRLLELARGRVREEDQRLRLRAQQVLNLLTRRFHDEQLRLNAASHQLKQGVGAAIHRSRNRLALDANRLGAGTRGLLQTRQSQLTHLGQAVRLLDPVNVLRRGYSITYHRQGALKDAAELRKGDIITTRLYNGFIKSMVEEDDAQQGTDLFKSNH